MITELRAIRIAFDFFDLRGLPRTLIGRAMGFALLLLRQGEKGRGRGGAAQNFPRLQHQQRLLIEQRLVLTRPDEQHFPPLAWYLEILDAVRHFAPVAAGWFGNFVIGERLQLFGIGGVGAECVAFDAGGTLPSM